MKRSRILSLVALALALVAMPAFAASHAKPRAKATSTEGTLQGVQITSQVQGTLSGGTAVSITFTGSAAHTQSGLTVIFTVKQLTAVNSVLGSLSASLDPNRASVGTLGSTTFPTTHTQNFFLRIKSSTVGTLISDAPLTLSAVIQSSPPTATYKSTTGNVVFYRAGDPNKQPVLTVQSVTSDVKPADSQTVNISSLVTAAVGTSTMTIQFVGSATDLVSGRNVLFISKSLTAVNPGPLGATTVALDSRESSAGTLGSDTFPTTHTQSFFLQIQSQNMGTLVADSPVILSAPIQGCPPTATYKLSGRPVPFYRQGDPNKQTVLTIQDVVSDVTPGK
jgi:hypothetical protein